VFEPLSLLRLYACTSGICLFVDTLEQIEDLAVLWAALTD